MSTAYTSSFVILYKLTLFFIIYDFSFFFLFLIPYSIYFFLYCFLIFKFPFFFFSPMFHSFLRGKKENMGGTRLPGLNYLGIRVR